MVKINLDFKNKKFSQNHQIIANYIINNVDVIPFMVEKDIAEACSVGISTVSRFWSTIGYNSFKEFKQHLMQEVSVSPADKIKTAFDKLENNDGVSELICSSSKYLEQTADGVDNVQFKKVAAAINECSTVHIYASGPSVCLSSLLEFRLRRFDINVNVLAKSGHELFEDLIHIKKEDIILIFGFVHESPEIKVLFDLAHNVDCKTVLITDLQVHPMLQQADFCLYTARGELWEFHSMLAPLALIESLIVFIGKVRGKKALAKLQRLYELRNTYKKLLPKKV